MKVADATLAATAFLVFALAATAGRVSAAPPRDDVGRRPIPRSLRIADPNTVELRQSTAAADTYVVASFDFEGVGGGPDPQGWVSVDRTVHTRTFWHVDDYGVPAGGGTRAMWCGLFEPDAGTCAYGCLPGYGNAWDEILEMPTALSVQGDVVVSFLARIDAEPGYDMLHVQYQAGTGYWYDLMSLGERVSRLPVSIRVPTATHQGMLRLRFRFTSDEIWSDEDCGFDSHGGAWIDNLSVIDASGTRLYEDFEDEPLEASGSSDGAWVTHGPPAFGDFAGLIDVSTLGLPDASNLTHAWGFLEGSTDSTHCHYLQPRVTVPTRRTVDGDDIYLWNEIWSPAIDWTRDANGQAIPASASVTVLEFQVYRDMDLNSNMMIYAFQMRTRPTAGMCEFGPWRDLRQLYWGPQRDWYTLSRDVTSLVESAATEVQIALVAQDMCGYWCGVYECCWCRTEAPLFDNVRLLRIDTTTVDVAREPPDPPPVRVIPNPFNPGASIRFNLERESAVVLRVYAVTGERVRTLVDGRLGTGEQSVAWDGRDDRGQTAASGVYYARLSVDGRMTTRKMVLVR